VFALSGRGSRPIGILILASPRRISSIMLPEPWLSLLSELDPTDRRRAHENTLYRRLRCHAVLRIKPDHG
jgi:hypothetical protein